MNKLKENEPLLHTDGGDHGHGHGHGHDSPRSHSNNMSSPTLHNFISYVETGTSADHDPNKGPESSDTKKARTKLVRATAICMIFMIVELIGGYVAGSLAIMTDAAHLASDVSGFIVSLFALYLAERKATLTLSYGFKRAEIIGAILSVILIWFLTGILLWEAIRRTQEITNRTRKTIVDGKIMFIVASFGLVANCTLLLVLGHDHGGHGHSHGGGGGGHGHAHGGHGHAHGGGGHGHAHGGGGHGHAHGENNDNQAVTNAKPTENINVSAAYIHALGDLIQSVGVCIAGGLIWYFPGTEDKYYYWQLADPITTFLFSILVLFSTYGIIKTSLVVLMEGVPEGINAVEIHDALLRVPDIIAVHHLHIWAISLGDTSLSVHIVYNKDSKTTSDEILRSAQHVIRRFDIYHSTIQVELDGGEICKPKDCAGTPCDSYALACDDDKSNCYQHDNDKNKENGNGSYGSF